MTETETGFPGDTPLPQSGYRGRDVLNSVLPAALAFVSFPALVLLSVALVDRPFSTWAHAHLGDRQFSWFTMSYEGRPLPMGPFSLMAGPGQVVGPIAAFVLAILVITRARGVRLALRGRIFLTLGLSVLTAMQINAILKRCFGRTWPESWLGDNPSWIGDAAFGFSPFHGGAGWASFPSGHTTAITTPAVILWFLWPELRPVWAALVVSVIAGLLGGNYHFVSDIIGGLYLGTVIGLTMLGIMHSPRDRLNWRVLFGRGRS
jgi:membrane-associated phospholipid phosphatase